jgi:rhodanese-related sulfurtransferase
MHFVQEADEYHEAMKDPEAVIIDVRNAYESAIGHFQPPESGAKLIDPKMRNSIEFPKWLNSEETKKQLEGKKVLVSVSLLFDLCGVCKKMMKSNSLYEPHVYTDVLHRWHKM